MKHGIVLLTDLPWREAAPRWRAAEEMGFADAWTYDHLVWSGLPDSPWAAAMPTLAAAAGVTSTIGLGTFVASPNFRHPYPFLREIQALDDISDGRFRCGLGAGGDLDARALGDELTLKERVGRFHEFVPLLDRLLREDRVKHQGKWFRTEGVRTLPAGLRPRVPLLIAANGPRSIALAAATTTEPGDGWITYGGQGDTIDAWLAHVGTLVERFEAGLVAAGRPEDSAERLLSLDSSPVYSLSSVELYVELTGRAADLGFTGVIAHWPRPEGPYAGSETVLEAVAATF